MHKPILILGATSSIAKAAAKSFAAQGHAIYLAGRDLLDMERIAADLKIRYNVEVSYGYFCAHDHQSHKKFLMQVIKHTKELEGVLLAFGNKKDQKKAFNDFSIAFNQIQVNYVGACSILSHCADYFADKKKGFIIAISSAWGDICFKNDYIYGSAKGGLTLYLQGLRARLHKNGVRVITIKPGKISSSLFPSYLQLQVSPEWIGTQIAKSIHQRQNVIFLPSIWKYIIQTAKLLPKQILYKL